MKKFVIASLALAALAAPAFAADMPVKAPQMVVPTWNWTGWYVGINGGYGTARSEHVDTTGTSSGVFSQSGGLVGGTVGFNWQTGAIVLGVEGDLDWAQINGSQACGGGSTCFTNMRGFGTARARLGYAFNNWLPYVTGGVAFADVRGGQTFPGVVATDTWKAGGTVGAGLEFMFAPHWSAKAEYLYANFGSSADVYNGLPLNVAVAERRVNIFRGGINWHF